jgi:hypothetical protein
VSGSAFAYDPPPELAGSPVVAALRALPAAKQAEMFWRLAVAADSGDERQVRTLLRALRGLVDPDGVPRCDPATERTMTADEFSAAFGS